VVILPFIDTFQWVGLWNLIDIHVSWSDDTSHKTLYYTCSGFVFLLVSFTISRFNDGSADMEDSWKMGIPRSFGWRRKTKNFLKYCLGFVGFMLVWVGASNKWDVDQEILDVYIIYACLSAFILYMGTEILSIEALFYSVTVMVKKWRECQGVKVIAEDESYILDEEEE